MAARRPLSESLVVGRCQLKVWWLRCAQGTIASGHDQSRVPRMRPERIAANGADLPEVIAHPLLKTASIALRDVRCQGRCRHKSTVEHARATHLVFPSSYLPAICRGAGL